MSHRTLGLGLAVLLLLQAATGTLLVFRDELLLAFNGRFLTSSPAVPLPAADRILDEVERRYGQPSLERLVFPRDERTAVLVYLRSEGVAGRRVIASDPITGQVLGELSGIGLTPFLVFRIHEELLLGKVGHALLVAEGIGLLYLVLAGFLMGRPRRQGPIRVRWSRGGIVRRFDLHRSAGLVVLPLLVFAAVTGIVMQFEALAKPPAPPASYQDVDWKRLMPHLARIVREYPPAAIKDVRFSEDRRTATILAYTDAVVRPLALDYFKVDLATGESAGVARATQETAGQQFERWMYPLHTGKALGSVGALIATVTGLGLAAMPVLGFLLWRAKRVRQPAHAGRAEPARQPL